MSQLTHPAFPRSAQLKTHRLIALGALLALIAAAAIVLALAIDGNQSTSSTAEAPQSVARSDGGPEEAAVAAAVGTGTVAPHDESRIAAAIGSTPVEASSELTRRSAPALFDPDSIKAPPGERFDGGPDEGTRGR